MLTQAELKARLHYDPLTGIFTWLVDSKHRKTKGKIAGSLGANGYVVIVINVKAYKAHRLAWLYVHGKWPEKLIDHINMVRDDNRLLNLREATHAQNMSNRKKKSNNTSGYIGVSKHRNKWSAYVRKDNVQMHIGLYSSPEEASIAREEKARQLFGEFYNGNA